MDRGARTAGIADCLSDFEVLQRAGIEVDLTGILRLYGWRSVRGDDDRARRVLTNPWETRRIVVIRHPEDGQWQWWDTAVGIVGDIVDAIRQLVGYKFMREIIIFLRNVLNHPLEPLPVLEAKTQDAASERIRPLAATDQLRSGDEHSDERLAQVAESDEVTVPVLSEELVETEDGLPNEATEFGEDAPTEAQKSGAVEAPKISPISPPKTGKRRR